MSRILISRGAVMQNLVYSLLVHPTAGMVMVPIVFLIAGGLAKKIVCADGWKCEHFYLGIESALAAMASAVIFMTNLRVTDASAGDVKVDLERLANLGLFLALTFAALLFIMAIHQSWEPRRDRPKLKLLLLGCFCNAVGLGLLAGSVVVAKGH